jgi:hypothetical protein
MDHEADQDPGRTVIPLTDRIAIEALDVAGVLFVILLLDGERLHELEPAGEA